MQRSTDFPFVNHPIFNAPATTSAPVEVSALTLAQQQLAKLESDYAKMERLLDSATARYKSDYTLLVEYEMECGNKLLAHPGSTFLANQRALLASERERLITMTQQIGVRREQLDRIAKNIEIKKAEVAKLSLTEVTDQDDAMSVAGAVSDDSLDLLLADGVNDMAAEGGEFFTLK